MKKNLTIFKPRDIIFNTSPFDVHGERVFALAISRVKDTSSYSEPIVITVSELLNYTQAKGKSMYAQLSTLGDTITDLKIRIADAEKEELDIVNIFSSYHYSDGIIKLKFGPEIYKQLKDYQSSIYTKVLLKIYFKLSSQYQIKICECLLSYASRSIFLKRYNNSQNIFTVDISILHSVLGLNNSLKIWTNFKNNILDKSLNEINKISDIIFKYKPLKQGRKIQKLQFSFEKRVTNETTNAFLRFDESFSVSDQIKYYNIADRCREACQNKERNCMDNDLRCCVCPRSKRNFIKIEKEPAIV